MAEIESRYVMKTKGLIPRSRTVLRRIFTIAKANSMATIIMNGFHSLQVFPSTIVSTLKIYNKSLFFLCFSGKNNQHTLKAAICSSYLNKWPFGILIKQ